MSTATTHLDIPEWTVTDRLRKAREHAGLDQIDLAATLEVSRKTIGNYENGRTAPRRTVILAWALATGVPLDWILTGESPEDGPDTPGGQPKPPTCRYGDSTSTIRVLHAA